MNSIAVKLMNTMKGALLFGIVFVIGCGSQPASDTSTTSTPGASPATPEKITPAIAEGVLTEPEEGFRLLSREDFEIFSNDREAAQNTWSVKSGLFHCTGKPKGYLYTRDSFKNFTLKLDYRFEPSERHRKENKLQFSNTGVLIYISGEHKQWPLSLEVQGKHVEMASIKENGGAAKAIIQDQPENREAARKEVGEWNSLKIVSKEGVLTSFLNGTQICQNEAGELSEGQIGLQSEGFEVEFRNIQIQPE